MTARMPLIAALLIAITTPEPISSGEFTVETKDDATLARLATERNQTPQEILQQLVDGYLKGQAQNAYRAEVQRLREACRAGKYEDAEQCAALRARQR